MHLRSWLASAVTAVACAHAAPAPPQARLPGAECYASRSITWPLGDTTTYRGIVLGSWLVLTPEPYAAGSSRLRAFAYDNNGNAQEGTWWQDGDTLTLTLAVHDLFNYATLLLTRTATGLVGTGSGTTDVLVQTAPGHYYEGTRHAWVARFERVECERLPAWHHGS